MLGGIELKLDSERVGKAVAVREQPGREVCASCGQTS